MDIATALNRPEWTIRTQIRRANINPVRYIGPTAVYSLDVLDKLREIKPVGRPKKPKGE